MLLYQRVCGPPYKPYKFQDSAPRSGKKCCNFLLGEMDGSFMVSSAMTGVQLGWPLWVDAEFSWISWDMGALRHGDISAITGTGNPQVVFSHLTAGFGEQHSNGGFSKFRDPLTLIYPLNNKKHMQVYILCRYILWIYTSVSHIYIYMYIYWNFLKWGYP